MKMGIIALCAVIIIVVLALCFSPRLAPSIRKSIRKRMARLLWPNGHGIVRRGGVLYLLDLEDYKHDKYILQWGAAEKEQRAFFFENVRRRDCKILLDIGANHGLYAICAGLQTNCKTIIAYEADQRCIDRLRAQLLINRLSEKIETRVVAVSNHTGTAPLTLTFDNSIVTEPANGAKMVPSVRLDDELHVTGQRIALKIDVESHEFAVLEGMRSLLRNNDCFLQVECWEENAATFIAAMQTEGYKFLHRIAEDHYFSKKE